MRNLRGLLCVLILILTWTLPTRADDWPQWFGPDRRGMSREDGLLEKWPQGGPELLWEKPLGEGYSTFAVVGDRAWTQYQREGAQWAICIDTATGDPVWKFRTGDEYKKYPGPRATPTIDGDRAYIIDAQANLYCVEAATGDVIWNYNILKKYQADDLGWAGAMSPLIDGDKLLLNPGESGGNSIVAVNKMNGELIWRATEWESQDGLDDMAGYSSPVIRTLSGVRQYVFFLGTGATGIRAADGKQLWHFPWKTSFDVHSANPITKDDHVFITSGYNVGCVLMEISGDGPQKTSEVWRSRVIRSQMGTPILYEAHLYGFDEYDLVCVEFMTGQKKWETGAYRKGTLVMAGGMFYVLGERGNLALVKPNVNSLQVVSEFQTPLSRRRCWTMPVVSNGKLFARDETKMVCYDVSAD